ncbi:MAG: DUF4105 domain-containing protein [Muribaculaceae bacterium]|nr:DUF4105 domain-containing protein [Muribaculaceae bacterium]
MAKYIMAFVACVLSAIGAVAQEPAVSDSVPRVSLVTCHAGSVMYELCGHTAIRVQVGNEDLAVNYGLFEFQTENFAIKFLKGETDYRVGAYPFSYFLRNYVREDRRVVEQELNLTPEQAWRLVDLLIVNMRPENCVYRYNYVKNNCATKPVDVIEMAVGDSIKFSQPDFEGAENWTFRREMRHFHKNYDWYQLGIDFALGEGIDYVLPVREKMFAPESLESMMRGATVADSLGNAMPIVKAERVLHAGSPAQLPPTPWWCSPMAVFVLLLVVSIALSVRDVRRRRATRWFDAMVFAFVAIAGMIIAFLVFVSTHEATSPNWNLAWLNPLALVVPIFVWLKKCKKIVLCYHFVNFAVIILLMLCWPFIGQVANAAFLPLALSLLARSASYLYINLCQEKKVA